jgi:hypothetical protein
VGNRQSYIDGWEVHLNAVLVAQIRAVGHMIDAKDIFNLV